MSILQQSTFTSLEHSSVEVKAGGHEFEANQGYTAEACLKKEVKKNKEMLNVTFSCDCDIILLRTVFNKFILMFSSS